MAIVNVQSHAAATTFVTTASNVTSGNLLVVMAAWWTVLGTATCSDTVGTVYTRRVNEISTGGVTTVIFTGIAGASGACTATISGGGGTDATTSISEFSGVQNVLDVAISGHGNAATPAPLSITTGTAGDLIFLGVSGFSSSTTYSAGSGYVMNNFINGNDAQATEWQAQVSAGVITGTFGATNNTDYSMGMIAMLATGAPPPPPPPTDFASVSKVNLYAVTAPPAGVNVSKANLYAVTAPPSDVNVSKINLYVVVEPGIALAITCGSPPGATVGVPYSHTFPITGGTGPYTFEAVTYFGVPVPLSLIPWGLSLDAATGVISGTPIQTGTLYLTIQVTDSLGAVANTGFYPGGCSITFLDPLSIICDSPPAGVVGTPYSHEFPASGGTPPYQFSIPDGSLPSGLSLDADTGVASGTPSSAGTFPFTVEVMDAGSPSVTDAVTIPPAYNGYDFGNSPCGTFAFEYNGTQYAFLEQEGGGPLGGGGDVKLHTLCSANAGATWAELDSPNAPAISIVAGGGGSHYTVARDGSHVIVVSVNMVYPGDIAPSDLTVQTFDLTTGTWGAAVVFAAPVVDFAFSGSGVLLSLAVRGPNDYILYYSGPKEISGLNHWGRSYYAAFSGAAFGTGILLPNQSGAASHGRPMSVCVDAAGITHFVIQLQFGTTGLGANECHVALSPSNVFGAMSVITPDDPDLSATIGGMSRLITIPGTPERLATAVNVYDSSGSTISLRMFYADAVLNPVWSDSVITDDQTLQIYPDNTNIVPQCVALGHANGRLVCVWAVSDDNSEVGNFTWYASHSSTDSTFDWTSPAVFQAQPDFTYAPQWSSTVAYAMGDDVQTIVTAVGGIGDHVPYQTFRAIAPSLNQPPNPDGVTSDSFWSYAGWTINFAHATQVYAYTMAVGVGVLTVWSGYYDDLIAQFSSISPTAADVACSIMITAPVPVTPPSGISGDVLTGRIFQGLGTAPTRMRLSAIDDGLTAVGTRSLRLSPQRDPAHTNPRNFMLFRNGLLLTEGQDYTVSGPWILLVTAQSIFYTDSFTAVISMGGEACSTFDGSIAGAVDGANYIFVLPFAPSKAMLFRNGLLLTDGLDYAQDGNVVTLSASKIPAVTDVLSARLWRSGGPVQVTTWDDTLDYAVASEVWTFRNGLAMSAPLDATRDGNTITFAAGEAPQIGDVVTLFGWTPNVSDPDMPPLNLPVRFGSDDGSISGLLNGVNNLFTLGTAAFVAQLLLFWNGDLQTEGPDYTWACQQVDSAGAWATVIEMRNGQIPNADDLLSAQVFLQ